MSFCALLFDIIVVKSHHCCDVVHDVIMVNILS